MKAIEYMVMTISRRKASLNIDAWIDIELRDPNGKPVKKIRTKAMSFVGNIIRLIYSIVSVYSGFTGSVGYAYATQIILDTGNTAKNISFAGSGMIGARAPSGDASAGIVVGSGSAPVSLDNYNLASPIPHGTGTGQLYYGDTLVSSLVTGTIYQFTISRTFTNQSGQNITISEVGILVRLASVAYGSYSALIARDLLPSPVTIPPNYSLTVVYTIQQSL